MQREKKAEPAVLDADLARTSGSRPPHKAHDIDGRRHYKGLGIKFMN